jgi:hypothetical protein
MMTAKSRAMTKQKQNETETKKKRRKKEEVRLFIERAVISQRREASHL